MLCALWPPPPPPRVLRPSSRRVAAGAPCQVLSNETTFTRWAYVNQIAWIYRAPDASSPRVGRLTWNTPDGFSSIYLVLARALGCQRPGVARSYGFPDVPTDRRAGSSAARWDRFT